MHHDAEDAFEAQCRNQGAASVAPDSIPLPNSVRPTVVRLMSEAATLEREMQNLMDAAQRQATLGGYVDPTTLHAETDRAHLIETLHKQWISGLDQLVDDLRTTGVAPASAKLLERTFAHMDERIAKLNRKLLALALAELAASSSGPDEFTQ